ncbi:MAG: 5'-methylthioadenosine/adenosylhomocysteine nucleosidase [Clostridia bacterium]|nr:5'-methylthioadenosine/adenosylhomocysteine nucleosidase [Clostridia bacterium]
MTGIICAMEKEARNIIANMAGARTDVIAGAKYVSGDLYGKEAVVAVCGIGKVAAAICAQTIIMKYSPDEIINVGIAGGLTPDLKVFDVVVSRDLVQHDFNIAVFGLPAGAIPGIGVSIKATDRIVGKLTAALEAEGVTHRVGRIASGDQFIDSEEARRAIADKFGADACEMEGAAVAQACLMNGVEFAVLRTISDSGEGEYDKFAELAADRSAKVICRYMKE